MLQRFQVITLSRFRFAPSPNGRLHLGHAYAALFTARAARVANGEMLLRIEDIDIARSRPEFIEGIFEDLTWLGLSWPKPVRRQSEHFDDYIRATKRLDDMALLYPCTATRAEITKAIRRQPSHSTKCDPDGSPLYPGIFRDIPRDEAARIKNAGEPFALRLNMQKAYGLAREINGGAIYYTEHGQGPDGQTGLLEINPAVWGDIVIARKDVPTSYHLSVVTDDALQAITHVTRGQDLFHATSIHRLLQILLDLPEPVYHHHKLIRDETGRKLAKSAQDTSLLALRESGIKPGEILAFLDMSEN
ncbi:MAG: tRNA glutamyl-Q(34) synthetase GluQRS [Fimbriimonadaceae bacterium]|nr:tRNA glutamyl-Q(34) synthetase GluQRS [Alphaproteobacteria bacterium]